MLCYMTESVFILPRLHEGKYLYLLTSFLSTLRTSQVGLSVAKNMWVVARHGLKNSYKKC